MKKQYVKKLLAIIMAVVTVLSVTVVATANASADTEIAYYLEIDNPSDGNDGFGYCSYVKVMGKECSTNWMSVGSANGDILNGVTLYGRDVGEIIGVSLMTEKANDWYPNKIIVRTATQNKTIYCADWLTTMKPGNFYLTDKVYKVTINTGDETYAGTDQNINITLYDNNNTASNTINASEVQNHFNAFERNDETIFYIKVPDNFETLTRAEITLTGSLTGGSGWLFDDITIKSVSGFPKTQKVSKSINEWYYHNDIIPIDFNGGTVNEK